MLLERAFQLVEDAKAARVPTDAAVWNALVTAAGRAGQLQRAFNVLEEMLLANTRPNDRTYASLIDACARAGDKELALRVYRKAQREVGGALAPHASARLKACVRPAAAAWQLLLRGSAWAGGMAGLRGVWRRPQGGCMDEPLQHIQVPLQRQAISVGWGRRPASH